MTGDAAFDAYTAAFENGETPLLGYMVLYSIMEGDVTRDDLDAWMRELDLDEDLIPPPLRHVDAYERVTGPDGVRVVYSLDDPAAPKTSRRRPRRGELTRTATLMVRPVRKDGGRIVRHIVREVRDEENTSLSYDTRLGEVVFHREAELGSADGAGILTVDPDHEAIAALPEGEQGLVHAMLADIQTAYKRRCVYLTGDRLRSVIRSHIEHLGAVRIRPTGGVYFVHRKHTPVLSGLRDLVARFGPESHLSRVPLPDQAEMREMIAGAYSTRAKDELNKLATDIAAAQRASPADVAKLHGRFNALQEATVEQTELLSTALDDTNAALHLVSLQLRSLLITSTADDEQDT